jgi:hypothetical protein
MALRDFLRNNWRAVTITVTVVVFVIAAIVILRNMPLLISSGFRYGYGPNAKRIRSVARQHHACSQVMNGATHPRTIMPPSAA